MHHLTTRLGHVSVGRAAATAFLIAGGWGAGAGIGLAATAAADAMHRLDFTND